MEKKRILKLIVRAIIIAVLLLLCILVFGILFMMLTRRSKRKSNRDSRDLRRKRKREGKRKFRYLQKNRRHNRTSVGFADVGETMSEESFLSYQDPSGNYVLVSSVDSCEYQCTGNCYCEQKSQSRSIVTSTLARPVFYLVAALSSSVAYNLATSRFEDECHTLLEESCSSTTSQIRSEIGTCEQINVKNNNPFICSSSSRDHWGDYDDHLGDIAFVDEENAPEEDIKEFYAKSEENYFLCRGNCLDAYLHFAPPEHMEVIVPTYWKEGDCLDLEMETKVTIQVPKNEYLEDFQVLSQLHFAEMYFIRNELSSFCTGESTVRIKEWDNGEITLCFSYDMTQAGGNPTVQCMYSTPPEE